MIKNILFDMGGVLIRWEPALFVSRLPVSLEDQALLQYQVYDSADWVRLDRGTVTEEEAMAEMKRRLPERLHPYVAPLVLRWENPPLSVEGTPALARALQESGYGLYLLSNAGKRHRTYWPKFEAAELFGNHVFISADVRLLKPDPAFYETALSRFSLRPEECVFIDDNPVNAEGAERVGLSAVVFHGDAGLLRRELEALGVSCGTETARL